jgi:hypothetical protein
MIGTRIVTVISALLTEVASESSENPVSRASQKPYVVLKKRKSGRGREDGMMRIEEGITVVPLKPKRMGGTNERDDVGYRFLISIAPGTLTDTIVDDWPVGTYEQVIRQRFQNSRVGSLGLTDSWEKYSTIEPGDLPEKAKLDEGLEASFLVLTDYIREARRVPI